MLLSAGGIGDELGGVAGAAGAKSFRDGVAGSLAAGVDDLPHAIAAARAEIEVQAFSWRELFEGQQMRLGQVIDVDIVADASSIGSGLVVAENRDLLPLAEGDLQHDGNQVRFRCVIFP